MKISKIVSAAILSVAVSGFAFGAENGGGVATNPLLDFFNTAKQKLADIANKKGTLANDISAIDDATVKNAFKDILVKAKELTIPDAGFNIENFAMVEGKQVGLKLTNQASKPMLEISYDGKKDVFSLGADDALIFNPRQLDKVDPSLKNFKDQEDITHDAEIDADIKANNKNKAMIEYLNLIVSGDDNIFGFLIKNNENLTLEKNIPESTDNATTQNAHPHLQKIAKILDAAKKAKAAEGANGEKNEVDFADIAIGDKFRISIDTNGNEPKLLIKDTQATIGTDTFILKQDGALEYVKNTTALNADSHILLNFKATEAAGKVTEAVGDDGSIGLEKASADVVKAKALLREAIDTVLNTDIDTLKNYTTNSEDGAVKSHIKKILELAKDKTLVFLDKGGRGISADLDLGENKKAKIILKHTDNSAELDIIYDSTGANTNAEDTKLNKFVLAGETLTFTEAEIEDNKLKALAAVDGVKEKIKQALDGGSNLNLDEAAITKAKEKADLYQILVANLPKVLTKEKIDALINAGTEGIENTDLKAIVDKATSDITTNIDNINNETITLKIKANKTIEISKANGKKDTITLTEDKFKITTDNKIAKPVLQELAEIKSTLDQNSFNAAIAEAKRKIPQEGGQGLTSKEVNKRQAFLDAVYKNEGDNALKTILEAIKDIDLASANSDADILGKIKQEGQNKIKTMLEKAEKVVEYVKSLALEATIGGATVKLEILDNNTPALTIEKDGKKDTFKLSGDNNEQLAYESAKTPTKDSVLHLLSKFDSTNLNDTLSVLIAQHGGEITSQNITAGNIEEMEDVADAKLRDLKVAEETLAAINAGEKATKEKVKTLEEKVKTLETAETAANKAKTDAEAAKTAAEKIVTDAGENATPEQKAAAQRAKEVADAAAEKVAEVGIAKLEADAELEITKEAAEAAKKAVPQDADAAKKAEAIENAKKDIQAKSKQVDVLNDALAETNVNTVKANNTLKEKEGLLATAQDAYNKATAEQKADKLKELNNAKQAVADAKEEVGDANADRAYRATRKLDNTTKQIALSLGDISADNEVLNKLFLADGTKKENIVDIVKNVANSVTTSADSISKISNVDIVKFNTDLSTATRLASLSNPFNADLALASAIKHLKDDSFASAGDGALSSIVREYTDRFNYDNNLWGSVLGGKTSVKNGASPKIFGVTLGYDKRFDNMIVGATTTYTQTKADKSDLELKGKNIQLGLYTRGYFDENEVDARINFNFGDNKLKRTTAIGQTDGKFDSFATSFDLTYGRIYQLDNDVMIKPLAGAGYTYLKTKSFTEKGEGALSYSSVTTKVANLKAGVELRKYVEAGKYFYITPGIEGEIYKNVKDPIVKFIGAENGIKLVGDDKKNTYFTLQTGANFNVTDSLSTNINFGTKLGSKNKFYNGTVGVNYKF
ncbi:autotransporter domain-containing protein [Campylobacter pinnipediorum]|uniref:autotransporter domain-containing protein n=1 Tax=Campylobacter pinnipediorum TaxID=1965231 RepID=UPI000995216E|nr:autotransporter outer membrane beta-barrel domain-containing protein [Campylobacter pinnipediorum]AQW82316.1 autotransporter domain protein [Campylobacter pinnipediorum subsp. pinnipediorum]